MECGERAQYCSAGSPPPPSTGSQSVSLTCRWQCAGSRSDSTTNMKSSWPGQRWKTVVYSSFSETAHPATQPNKQQGHCPHLPAGYSTPRCDLQLDALCGRQPLTGITTETCRRQVGMCWIYTSDSTTTTVQSAAIGGQHH